MPGAQYRHRQGVVLKAIAAAPLPMSLWHNRSPIERRDSPRQHAEIFEWDRRQIFGDDLPQHGERRLALAGLVDPREIGVEIGSHAAQPRRRANLAKSMTARECTPAPISFASSVARTLNSI